MSERLSDLRTNLGATAARISLQQSGLRWQILTALLVVTCARLFSPPIGAIAPPRPESAFDATETTFNLVANSGSVIFMASALIGGAVADLFDRRATFLVGTLAMIVANVACMLAFNLETFWAGFLFAGIGATITGVLTTAIIRLAFEEEERPIAIAWNVAVGGISFIAAQAFLYLLEQVADWRLSYVPGVVAGVIGFKLAYESMPSSRAVGRGRAQEVVGITAWSLVVLALTIGVVAYLTGDAAERYVTYSFAVGVIGAILMVIVEVKELRFSVRRTLRAHDITGPPVSAIVAVILGGVALSFAFFGGIIQFYGYTTSAQQRGPVEAGLMLLPTGIAILAGALATGDRFSDRTVRFRATSGMVALAVGIAGLLLAKPDGSYWVLIVPMLLIGAGFSIASTGITTVLLSIVPADLAGVSSGVSSATAQAGRVLGAVWLAVILIVVATRDYEDRLINAGVPPDQIENVLDLTDTAIQYHQLGSNDFGGYVDELNVVDPSKHYLDAYTTGLRWSLVVAILVAALGALALWVGLRDHAAASATQLSPDSVSLAVDESDA